MHGMVQWPLSYGLLYCIRMGILAEYADYTIAFFTCAGCVVFTTLFVFKLEVAPAKRTETTAKGLKKLMSKPALIFFSLLFVNGFQWGIHDTYLNIYLSEEMNATSVLISEFE